MGEGVKNRETPMKIRSVFHVCMTRDSLIKAGSVGVLVLLYDGDNEGDEFGPEVEVLDAGTLLIWRDCLRLKTQRDNELTSQRLCSSRISL